MPRHAQVHYKRARLYLVHSNWETVHMSVFDSAFFKSLPLLCIVTCQVLFCLEKKGALPQTFNCRTSVVILWVKCDRYVVLSDWAVWGSCASALKNKPHPTFLSPCFQCVLLFYSSFFSSYDQFALFFVTILSQSKAASITVEPIYKKHWWKRQIDTSVPARKRGDQKMHTW